MNIIRLITVIVLAVFLAACSHFKSGKKSEGAQTDGIDDQSSFEGHDISDANKFKAPYDQRYLFDLNKYDVKDYDVESINVQAEYLVKHRDARIRLEGNCDERGSREYNIALGWKRAKAVAEVLKQQGVSDVQIVMVSYGKEKPIAFGNDEEAHAKNRRVDLIYEAK